MHINHFARRSHFFLGVKEGGKLIALKNSSLTAHHFTSASASASASALALALALASTSIPPPEPVTGQRGQSKEPV